MSKEIGFYARNTEGYDREKMKAFAESVLAPERIKRTKGLMWIDDEGMALLEAALKRPEEPREIEPQLVTVLLVRGASNPRFEYGMTDEGEKVGVLIPNRQKGKLLGKRVQVEVITSNDAEKSYRLQCHKFQTITE